MRLELPRSAASGVSPLAARHAGPADLMSVAEAINCCAPLAAASLTDEEAEATAELFRALGDPARVRIVNLLGRNEEVCGCELNDALGLSQPTISHHLKKLHEAGLLDREQRGRSVYYSLRREAVAKLAAVTSIEQGCC